MNQQTDNWALIPSDPAVFDDMLQQYGIQDTTVQEVVSIDFVEEEDPSSVHGLMFISRYAEEELPIGFDKIDPLGEAIVFTAQVVTNACATLALLAILLNASIEKGEILTNFLRFTKGFSPVNRGLCLGSYNEVKKIHNSFANNANQRAEHAFNDSSDTTASGSSEYTFAEDFHYTSYIYKNGYVWELDGLKKQPVRLQECTQEEWLVTVRPIIQARMEAVAQDDLAFSLMAIKKDSYHTKLAEKNIYDRCLHLVNEAVQKKLGLSTLSRHRKAFFASTQDTAMPHYATMVDIWHTVCRQDFEATKMKLGAFAEQLVPFNREVDMMNSEKKAARAGVSRQKWDYFPFIQQLFTSSILHGMLHDPSSSSKPKPTRKNAQSGASEPSKLKPPKKAPYESSNPTKGTKRKANHITTTDVSEPLPPKSTQVYKKIKSSSAQPKFYIL